LKSNGINIGKQTRVSYFDKLNEQEHTPKGSRIMNFETSEDRPLSLQELSNSKHKLITTSSKKPLSNLSIEIEEDGNYQKSELRTDLTPNSKQGISSKNVLLEHNMSNNA